MYERRIGGTDESDRRVNEWLHQHMDDESFHKLCYDSSITTRRINDYLNKNGNDYMLQIDPFRGMTPLHILAMNPHAPAECIAALLDCNVEAAFCLVNEQKTPLEARVP
uniref:Uncharacterized protein n=1 Tax=Chaetoceros debilis TaxID=122233 RepID=A0A7S3V9K1_9STRA